MFDIGWSELISGRVGADCCRPKELPGLMRRLGR